MSVDLPGDAGEAVVELLRAGVAAARAGRREEARRLLARVVEQDERNVQAWLWLSGVVETLEERELCLENVLTLDPANDAARRGLDIVREQQSARWLDQGIAAARMGQPAQARDLLRRVVEWDESNVEAWRWLGEVVESPEEREICLENVLTLDPNAHTAREALAELRARRELERTERPPPPAPQPAPPEPEPPQPEATGPSGEAGQVPDVVMEEYLCPYCAVQTQPEDRVCPSCGRPLWVKPALPRQEPARLGMALILQVACAVLLVIGLFFLLTYLVVQVDLQDPVALARLYFGADDAVPAGVAAAAFDLVPPWSVLVLAGMLLLTLVVLVGLYLRWEPVFYLFLVNGVGVIGCGMLITTLLWDAGVSSGRELSLAVRAALVVVDLSLALAVFGLVLQMRGDFFQERTRLRFRLDRDVLEGRALLVRGRDYGRRGMWGLAALHLRRAAMFEPDEIDVHLALAVAYVNLKRYEQAEAALSEARRVDPAAPQLAELAALLDDVRVREGPERDTEHARTSSGCG